MAASRIIREGFVDSEKVSALSWRAECFYHRLLLVADDYGLFDARPTILRTRLFPMHLDKVSNQDIQGCLREAEDAGLVRIYCVKGKDYVQIINFGQRRQSKPKFPLPQDVSHGDPRESTVNNGEPRGSTAYTETKTETETKMDEGYTAGACMSVEQFPKDAVEVERYMRAQIEKPKNDDLHQCAADFCDTFAARGWRDNRGIPLNDWHPAARKYARTWAHNAVRNPQTPNPKTKKKDDYNLY